MRACCCWTCVCVCVRVYTTYTRARRACVCVSRLAAARPSRTQPLPRPCRLQPPPPLAPAPAHCLLPALALSSTQLRLRPWPVGPQRAPPRGAQPGGDGECHCTARLRQPSAPLPPSHLTRAGRGCLRANAFQNTRVCNYGTHKCVLKHTLKHARALSRAPPRGSARAQVLGPAGSGKTTICAQLAQRFGLPHIIVGDLLYDEVGCGACLVCHICLV